MKFKAKYALAALALAVAGQSGAQVVSNLPSGGNSSLYFVALDEVAGRSYFSEIVANAGSTTTGAVRLDDIVSNPSGTWTISLSGLNTFAAGSASLDNLFGGFGAADTSATVGGGSTPATGNRRALASNAAGSAAPGINNGMIASSTGFGANYEAFLGQISGSAAGQCPSSPCIATASSDNTYAGIGNGAGIGLSWGNPAAPTIGNGFAGGTVAWDIYLAVTTSTSAIGAANVTLLALTAVLNLANNTLMISGPGGPDVPIPAAVWLLGSAMLGFLGIGRRKKAQSANGLVAA